MGNKLGSQVSDAVKQQAAGGAGQTPIYQYTDVNGGGELIELMKKASKTKDYKEVDDRIKTCFLPYLYNGGEGELVHISEIVQLREGWKKSEFDKKMMTNVFNLESMTEEMSRRGRQYKEVCWRLDKRGSLGETPLHVCFLKGTSIHADLAKRLLNIFPKLVKDIYVLDEFYGESVLHMSIVNEDPAMVKFLLDRGADYHQRCCGNFYIPEDLKASRTSTFQHEWFELARDTNYDGYTYWGEFPLGFATCMGQEECIRLLIARGADANLQDSLGNTALHMIVIHYYKMKQRCEVARSYGNPEDLFDLLISLGAKMNLKNKQNLTPLTLAAKLGHKEIYDHIVKVDREMYWIYGDVACAGYPLEHMDSISESGGINNDSVLCLIVYGEKPEHLEMIDGTVAQLLHEKWETFARFRFFRRFIFFLVYYAIASVAFVLRPATVKPSCSMPTSNITLLTREAIFIDPCYQLHFDSPANQARIILELLTLVGSIIYIVLSIKELHHQGYKNYFRTMMVSPSKTMFLISNILVIIMVPCTGMCKYKWADVLAVLVLLFAGPYFLFFCRGFKTVGEFVVMIYQMVVTDLLRFFSIYLIFLIGFSQAMFTMFRGYKNEMFEDAIESIMAMFRMSIGAFADIYSKLETNVTLTMMKDNAREAHGHIYTVQAIFVVYMVLVALLLVNMLIAMMGHTYDCVNQSQREWLRQWAKIILIVEQTITTGARRMEQLRYSQPMRDGRRALTLRWHLSKEEQEKIELQRQAERLQSRR
uniref:Transient receptor potential cation channel subfamily V n=1 Tax=Hirudo verbana TaxID=311461 RepID=A0A8G0VMW9_9ANNE|nr:transient receptor potential cation channel subfamily V [Hirudo verbana]